MIVAVNESKALKRVVFDNLAKTPERRGHGCIGDCGRRDEDLDDSQGHFSLSAPSWRGGYSLSNITQCLRSLVSEALCYGRGKRR